MTNITPTALSDADLLAETARAAGAERHAMSALLALLAEVDTRKLYLGLGYPSLFVYCTQALHLSEAAAYSRITAARSARRFPVLLTRLADGAVTLTTISLLAAHLTDDNCEALLEAARHRSRRDIERLVASLDPQPDVASSLRRLPQRAVDVASPSVMQIPAPEATHATTPATAARGLPQHEPALRRPLVAALAADRYLLRITLSQSARETLERARDLLRHQIPTGDAAAIVARALTVLVEQLEAVKHGQTKRPRRPPRTASHSRHVPAHVKRVVWTRDAGRCAFLGAHGRCPETGFLEFHHVVPFAAGGATDAENLELRCRAHNAYEATLFEQSSTPIGGLVAVQETSGSP